MKQEQFEGKKDRNMKIITKLIEGNITENIMQKHEKKNVLLFKDTFKKSIYKTKYKIQIWKIQKR